MKKLPLLIFIFLSTFSVKLFAQHYGAQWAKGPHANVASGSRWGEQFAQSVKKNGNVVVAGSSTAMPYVVNGDTLLALPDYRVYGYIFEYDTFGRVQNQAFIVPDTNVISVYVTGVQADSSNAVYISGLLNGFGNVDFDTIRVPLTSLQKNFVAKYISIGATYKVQWVKTFDSVDAWNPQIYLDEKRGFLYFGTSFNCSQLIVGHDTVKNGEAGRAVIVAQFDTNGVPQWARGAHGDTATNVLEAISCDNAGNVLISGAMSAVTTFGSTVLYPGTYYRFNHRIFAAKYSQSGTLQWVWSPVGLSHFSGYYGDFWLPKDDAFCLFASGEHIYVGGSILSKYVVIHDTLFNPTEGTSRAFLAELDASTGVPNWGKIFLDPGSIYSLDVSGSRMLLSGTFTKSSGYFDTIHLVQPTGWTDYTYDGGFFAECDLSGSALDAKAFPVGGDDQSSIRYDGYGGFYLSLDWANESTTLSLPSIIDTCVLDTLAPSSENSLTVRFARHPYISPYLNTQMNDNTTIDINIYPNPSTGDFTVARTSGPGVICIYSLLGQMVYQAELQAEKQQLQLHNLLLPGTYLVRVTSGMGSQFAHLVIR